LSFATKSKPPLLITQRGRATAVLMSLEAYERSQAERHTLLLLSLGEKEIAGGVGRAFHRVITEAGWVLSEG
jgi:PHD/YefM family antitoxin component YafN of YafNO toxin-antitoxin module